MNNQTYGRDHGFSQMGLFFNPFNYSNLKVFRGKVVDASTNMPLPSVHVYHIRNGEKIGVITNSQGEYIIEADPTDLITISFLGKKSIKTPAMDLQKIEYLYPKEEELKTVYITNEKEAPKNNVPFYLGIGLLVLVIASAAVDKEKGTKVKL